MSALEGFAQKDTIEQILALDEIRETKDASELPNLMELYAHPINDEAVDSMIFFTLSEVLTDQNDAILAGLTHESAKVRTLCVEKAGAARLQEAFPILLKQLQTQTSPEFIAETLNALGRFDDPALGDIFLPYVQSDDPVVASIAIKKVAATGDVAGRDALIGLIEADNDFRSGAGDQCALSVATAIHHLASFVDDVAADFLVTHIHHANPMVRRLVQDALISMGPAVLPALGICLQTGSKDARIMAANVIGFMGNRKGADLLVARMDGKEQMEANLKFAVYEALGRINSIRSIVCLTDGLLERDDLILTAVVTGLDNLYNSGVLMKLLETVEKGDVQASRVLQTIIMTRSARLFTAVYESETHASRIMDALRAFKDADAVQFFREVLAGMEGTRPAADLASLDATETKATERRILAADDSKAMLFFYQQVVAELGYQLVTAKDGLEALEHIRAGLSANILITDLNMPRMDGVELTREVRKLGMDIPILMATTESETSQADRATQAGVSAFITKPFSKEVLKEKIESIFSA